MYLVLNFQFQVGPEYHGFLPTARYSIPSGRSGTAAAAERMGIRHRIPGGDNDAGIMVETGSSCHPKDFVEPNSNYSKMFLKGWNYLPGVRWQKEKPLESYFLSGFLHSSGSCRIAASSRTAGMTLLPVLTNQKRCVASFSVGACIEQQLHSAISLMRWGCCLQATTPAIRSDDRE